MDDNAELSALDDQAFLAERRRVREALEHKATEELTARYAVLTEEFLRRARIAWKGEQDRMDQVKAGNEAAAVIKGLPRDAARLIAVEILLVEPETLGDDVLETCLYLLRERLTEAQPDTGGEARPEE